MRKTVPSRALGALLVVLLTSARGAADAPSPNVEKLIDQLGSRVFAEREQAARLLQARGPSVLPALRKALGHRDTEVRRRVQELIAPLAAAAAVAPKRITLKADHWPLADLLKEVETQTGYRIDV